MADLNPEVMKAVPGAAGSLVSMLFIKDNLPRRFGMFVGGSLLAYYFTPWLSPKVSIPDGMAGFVLGLLGMLAVSKAVDTWNALLLSSMLEDLLRMVFRLPPKENKP